jgi:hypothetical protein
MAEDALVDLVARASSLLTREAARMSSLCPPCVPSQPEAHAGEVALLRGASVAAGETARFTLRVANPSDTPRPVALFSTSFITELGYEIPAWRATFSPRGVAIPARGELAFEITIAVPGQTPAGSYSALILTSGANHMRTIIVLDVA